MGSRPEIVKVSGVRRLRPMRADRVRLSRSDVNHAVLRRSKTLRDSDDSQGALNAFMGGKIAGGRTPA